MAPFDCPDVCEINDQLILRFRLLTYLQYTILTYVIHFQAVQEHLVTILELVHTTYNVTLDDICRLHAQLAPKNC